MDKYLVTLAFVLLIFEVGWLAEDMGWVNINDLPGFSHHTQDNVTSLGQITMTKGRVRDRSESSLVWEEARQTHPVKAFESVLTLSESAALVKLHNGTEITLHENTLVTIEPQNNDPVNGPVRLHFKKGFLYAAASRGPQSVQAGDVIIVAQKNSQITVSSQTATDGSSTYKIENHQGDVKIIETKTNNVPTALKAGQSVDISGQAVVGSVKDSNLKLQWIVPKEGGRIYTHDEKGEIPFRWSGSLEKINITNKDSNSLSQLAIEKPDLTEDRVTLPLGNYIVKLEQNKTETFGRNISVWQAPKIYLLQPLPRERIRVQSEIKMIWSSQSYVAKYKWEISSFPDFKNLTTSGVTETNQAQASALPPGQYYWRVQGEDEQGYSIPELYFNTFNVIVNPLSAPKLQAPKIEIEPSSPKDTENQGFQIWQWILPQARADDFHQKNYSADFQWDLVEGAAAYTIEISETADFRQPMISRVVKTPEFKWKNFKFGKYFWRVAGQTELGELGLFSDVAAVDLTTIPTGPIIPGIETPHKPRPALTPTPVATPVATPLPKATPAPTPTPMPVVVYHPYSYSVEVGGDYSNSITHGSDFSAFTQGLTPGDLRFSLQRKREKSDIQGTVELKELTIMPQNSTTLPFQNNFTAYTGRLQVLFIDHQSTTHYGLLVLNEYPLLTRSGLESLNISTPVLGGPEMTFIFDNKSSQLKFQVAVLLGQMEIIEGLANNTWFIPWGQSNYFTLSLEARAMGGMSFTPTTIFGGQALLFLGVRW